MTLGTFFDHTVANLHKPAHGGIDRTTGKFVDEAATTTAIRVHVSKPKLDEALPGGAFVAVGDLVVHADASHNIEATDILEFHGHDHEVVVELRRFDVLEAVAQHGRRSYLVRRL